MDKLLSSFLQGGIENMMSTTENSNFDVNVKDESGATLLHHAVEFGNQALVRWLLTKNCNVNSQDSKGRTPLMMAVLSDQNGIALDLLSAGADINIVNDQNESILHMVFTQHRVLDAPGQLFREFRSKSSSSEAKAKRLMALGCHLYQAALFQNHRILEIMLEAGFPIDSMHPETKQTALHNAVMLGNTASVKVLLRHGADPEALDSNGSSPLFFIVGLSGKCSREILKMLLERGVSMTSVVTRGGMFQISPTLLLGDAEAISLLLKHNLDFTAKEVPDGRTVFHYLAVNTDPGIVEPLRRHAEPYDLNIVDSFGTSPLFYAVRNGSVEMTEFLLERGAKVDFGMCKNDYPPLYNAATRSKPNYDNARCVEVLLQHNADPQFIYNRKNTLLSVIDAALNTKNLNIIHPFIAHLALIEKLGTFVTEYTNSKIDSDSSYREYFNECQRFLNTKITGSVTVFKLLAGDRKKLAMHLNKRKLDQKLRRISNKQDVRSSYLYYYNTLRKRLSKAISHKSYRDTAARILSKIFRHQIEGTHLIINKMIDYLDERDIRQLAEV